MIKSAAIKQNGKIYTGRMHGEIIYDMVLIDGVKPPIDGEQGFITDDGKFVDRKEAAKIAFECGQTKKQLDFLYSDELIK